MASLTLALTATIDSHAHGEDATRLLDGIRHAIYVSVHFDPASPLVRVQEGGASGAAHATITALLRISDHAREANFYGTVLATFADFAVNEQPAARLVWHDAVCHQNRGAPKFAVPALDGLIIGPEGKIVIAARPRHVGEPLPADELVRGQGFRLGSDQTGRFEVQRLVARQSRVELEVKVYTDPCPLPPGGAAN